MQNNHIYLILAISALLLAGLVVAYYRYLGVQESLNISGMAGGVDGKNQIGEPSLLHHPHPDIVLRNYLQQRFQRETRHMTHRELRSLVSSSGNDLKAVDEILLLLEKKQYAKQEVDDRLLYEKLQALLSNK